MPHRRALATGRARPRRPARRGRPRLPARIPARIGRRQPFSTPEPRCRGSAELVARQADDLQAVGGAARALGWLDAAHAQWRAATRRQSAGRAAVAALILAATGAATVAAAALAAHADVSGPVAALLVVVPVAVGDALAPLVDAMRSLARSAAAKARWRPCSTSARRWPSRRREASPRHTSTVGHTCASATSPPRGPVRGPTCRRPRSTCRPVGEWRSSGPTDRASRPCSPSSPATSTRPAATTRSTASTCVTCRWRPCAA